MTTVSDLLVEAVKMFLDNGGDDTEIIQVVGSRVITDDLESCLTREIPTEQFEIEIIEEYRGNPPRLLVEYLERI